METWSMILISLSIIATLFTFFVTSSFVTTTTKQRKLPPGPPPMPLILNLLWLVRPLPDFDTVLRGICKKYGPMFTIHFENTPTIFVASNTAAHQALIENGPFLADRPPIPPTVRIITSNQMNISTMVYGATWRLLRKNLAFEMFQPSRIKSFSTSLRSAVADVLIKGLHDHHQTNLSISNNVVTVVDHIRRAMFYHMVFLCFGIHANEEELQKIIKTQRDILLGFEKFVVLDFWPRSLFKVVFRKRWEKLLKLRKDQEDLLLPIIHARRTRKIKLSVDDNNNNNNNNNNDIVVVVRPYIDTLLDLNLAHDQNRKLTEGELVTLCSEFMDAGTDAAVTALQWTMANVVKHTQVQEKLFTEIKQVVGDRDEVNQEDIKQMPYLKAVVLEGLRRHPPAPSLLPHKATQEITIAGYVVPKGGIVNFMVNEMAWNPNVWKDPMAFRPERFLMISNNGDDEISEAGDVDITGTKEVKMIPFGAGRRICPGYAMGIILMEYFVSNLVLNFNWTPFGEVDLTEQRQSTMVMKYPVKAYISPRHH